MMSLTASTAVQMTKELCPRCGIKLPISLPPGHVAWAWCRSKGCGGRWVLIDKRVGMVQ